MTDAGPIDLLAELRDSAGGRHDYSDLFARSVLYRVGPLVLSLASLADIISSKEFAGRDKDHEGLPELREIQRRRGQ